MHAKDDEEIDSESSADEQEEMDGNTTPIADTTRLAVSMGGCTSRAGEVEDDEGRNDPVKKRGVKEAAKKDLPLKVPPKIKKSVPLLTHDHQEFIHELMQEVSLTI